MTDEEIRKKLEEAADRAREHDLSDARQFGEVKKSISGLQQMVKDLDTNVDNSVKQMLRDAAAERLLAAQDREAAAENRAEQTLIMRDMLLSTQQQQKILTDALDLVKVATKGQVEAVTAAREGSKPDEDPALRAAKTAAEIQIIEARTKRDITLVSADATETQENSALRIAEAKEKAHAKSRIRNHIVWAIVALIGIAIAIVAAKFGFSPSSGGNLGAP